MSIPSDHKALMFVGAIAVLGAGVRVVRTSDHTASTAQPALERQMQAADSASKAGRGRRTVHDKSATRGRRGRAAAVATDTVRHSPSPGEQKGWLNGRLDLDVATAAQIDSLPGVTPTMAKRIVADRMQRGPFLDLDRLRRVSGVGPAFIKRIDSLVTFSGTFVPPNPADTVIPRPARAKSRGGVP